jgi:hypothetical protein
MHVGLSWGKKAKSWASYWCWWLDKITWWEFYTHILGSGSFGLSWCNTVRQTVPRLISVRCHTAPATWAMLAKHTPSLPGVPGQLATHLCIWHFGDTGGRTRRCGGLVSSTSGDTHDFRGIFIACIHSHVWEWALESSKITQLQRNFKTINSFFLVLNNDHPITVVWANPKTLRKGFLVRQESKLQSFSFCIHTVLCWKSKNTCRYLACEPHLTTVLNPNRAQWKDQVCRPLLAGGHNKANTWTLCYLSITMTKYRRQSTYKDKRFILAHRVGGFRSWSVGSITLGLWQTSYYNGSVW